MSTLLARWITHHSVPSRRARPAGAALLALALGAFSPSPASAQSGIGDIVYTVATVAEDSHHQHWAYLVWQATQPGLISNRVFAVYSKPGDPGTNAPFVRRSLVTLQTDARVIEPLLRRAENLGDDPLKLEQDLRQLFGSFIPPGTISRAEQLSAVLRGSLNDTRYYQNLQLLARNHAGINLALGFADAELIDPVGRTTFEVRAFDPATSRDLAVVGRVTVEAGKPTILPPPGPPVLVPETSAMGDLNLKFRWGTPDNLRRLGLMQFGYNLYRVSRDFALSAGWNLTNRPPLDVLSNLVVTAPMAVKRVNRVPITPGKLFTLAEAANVLPPTGDTNTMFLMDDDGRGKTNYINYGWTNGAQFFYYVAARDVLGRDGLLSTGLLATVCDRMPPLPPTSVHIENDFQYSTSTHVSSQALRVVWNQNTQTNEHILNYYVYRWTNLVQMNALQGDYGNNLIAVVPHIIGATTNSFLDNGAGSPTTLNAYGETYWYTVRAGDAGACAQNLSGPAGPAFGVLRDRVGPAAGTGYIEINCLQPYVVLGGFNYPKNPRGTDTNNFNLYLNCTRLDQRYQWAEFIGIATYTDFVGGPPTVISNFLGRFFYSGALPAVSTWWTPPRNPIGGQFVVNLKVICRAALSNGKVSNDAVATVETPGTATFADVEFQALTQSYRSIAGRDQRGCREHDPGGGGGGVPGTNNICVKVFPTATSKEYRIYRRVDDGPLSLLAQGGITNVALTISACENNPPLNGGSICFYVQLLDENGNPSPLTFLGCVDCAPTTPLPVPVLAKIVSTDNAASPGMKLSWFCPPYGVQRFELRIAGFPTPPLANLSGSLVNTGAATIPITITNFGTNLTLDAYSFITPVLGPEFGAGGSQFEVPCKIEGGKLYAVEVRALGKNGNGSAFSQLRTFLWTPTNAPLPQVPWPARGLPSTNANLTALAYYLSPTHPNPILRTTNYEGNAVLLGYGPLAGRAIPYFVRGNPPTILYQAFDPHSILFTNTFGNSLLPCAMYRCQVPTPAFPTVSGDTIQVSPLMEKLAYEWQNNGQKGTNTVIHDPFLTSTVWTSGDTRYLFLWLIDRQPQVSGAGYQYVLVRFGDRHEIEQLIPSNEVDVP